MGYSKVTLKDEASMIHNLKSQLEKHNKLNFSENEFSKVLNILNKGTVLDRAKTLGVNNVLKETMEKVNISIL